jgi:pyrroloquinoline quinone biosynthesis protein B
MAPVALRAPLPLLLAALAAVAPAPSSPPPAAPWAVVLGVAQDGGYPQAGTRDDALWDNPGRHRLVASLAVVDPESGERWLVDCTPDFPRQLHRLDVLAPPPATLGPPALAGVLLTHAHVGHYAGLIHLGREAMGARGVPVYAMPRMEAFLRGGGPWELLVRLGNVELRPLSAGVPVKLGARLVATPLLVPHRDEYSETVGFRIAGPRHSLLWLPDIDKWERWDAQPGAGSLGVGDEPRGRLEEALASVDMAYLDGTFFADGEVPGRAMAEIPHPFVRETILRLARLPAAERAKVRFVHLNRSNPLVRGDAAVLAEVAAAGMSVAQEGERVEL